MLRADILAGDPAGLRFALPFDRINEREEGRTDLALAPALISPPGLLPAKAGVSTQDPSLPLRGVGQGRAGSVTVRPQVQAALTE